MPLYCSSMTLRPLGWELSSALAITALIVAGVAADWLSLVGVALVAAGVLGPIAVVSFLVRLVVGIVDEECRRREAHRAAAHARTMIR